MFRGIAVNAACGSYRAQVCEVRNEGRVRVHRVVAAVDSGDAINRLSIEMQTQGAIVYALTAALHGRAPSGWCREQSNFDTYPTMRIADMPKVETVIVPSGDFRAASASRRAAGAPALFNAIFAATGQRIRTMSLKNHDLRSI